MDKREGKQRPPSAPTERGKAKDTRRTELGGDGAGAAVAAAAVGHRHGHRGAAAAGAVCVYGCVCLYECVWALGMAGTHPPSTPFPCARLLMAPPTTRTHLNQLRPLVGWIMSPACGVGGRPAATADARTASTPQITAVTFIVCWRFGVWGIVLCCKELLCAAFHFRQAERRLLGSLIQLMTACAVAQSSTSSLAKFLHRGLRFILASHPQPRGLQRLCPNPIVKRRHRRVRQ